MKEMSITAFVQRQNTQRKVALLAQFFNRKETVLDFGCGDLSMAQALYQQNPNLKITGVDIVDFGKRYKEINFQLYDGKILPFVSHSFDTVIAYHVFHHTLQPEKLFAECARVAKRRVIFVEPVYRGLWDFPGMFFMDWLFNVWKGEKISMTYNFKSLSWWKKQIVKNDLKLEALEDIEILPKILPTGRSLLFYASRRFSKRL